MLYEIAIPFSVLFIVFNPALYPPRVVFAVDISLASPYHRLEIAVTNSLAVPSFLRGVGVFLLGTLTLPVLFVSTSLSSLVLS